MTFEEELSQLSAKCKNYIRIGRISMYSDALKELADLFRRNECIRDQMKILIHSFYLDLSGFGRASFIDRDLIIQLDLAMKKSSIDINVLESLFFNWVQPDLMPQHALGLKDCWYLLRLCIEGKLDQADYILTRI